MLDNIEFIEQKASINHLVVEDWDDEVILTKGRALGDQYHSVSI